MLLPGLFPLTTALPLTPSPPWTVPIGLSPPCALVHNARGATVAACDEGPWIGMRARQSTQMSVPASLRPKEAQRSSDQGYGEQLACCTLLSIDCQQVGAFPS